MSAGAIPPNQSRQFMQATGTPPAGMQAGDTVDAQVVRDLGKGRYSLRAGNTQITAESSRPLQIGETIPLRVVEKGGKLAFEQVPVTTENPAQTTSGTADATAQATSRATATVAAKDEVSLASTFAVRVQLSSVAQQIPPLPDGGQVRTGIVAKGTTVALHFPSGVVVKGEAVPFPTGTLPPVSGGSNIPTSPLTPLPTANEAVLSLAFASIRANLLQGGKMTSLPVMIDVPIASVSTLLAGLQDGQVQGPLIPDGPANSPTLGGGENTLSLRLGNVPAQIRLPAGVTISAGDGASLTLTDEAYLSGEIKLSGGGAPLTEGSVAAALRATGLTPSPATREAAGALLAQAQPVTRDNIQALLALVAGRDGDARSALLAAGAALLARDIPLSPVLAAGLAAITESGSGIAPLLTNTLSALQDAGHAVPENTAATQQITLAQQALADLAVPLGEPQTATDLAKFFATLGRETLGQSQTFIENAAQNILASSPNLRNLDAALTALLTNAETPIDGTVPQAALLNSPLPNLGGQVAHPGVYQPLPGAETMSSTPPPLAAADAASIAQTIGEILATTDPARAAELARTLVENRDSPFRKRFTEELHKTEKAELSHDPALSRLADASKSLNDLGRRFIAHKAENLANQRQEPAAFVAEVPFRLAEEDGEGRLQVYYRRTKQPPGSKQWSARVVLDLETTRMGAVVGDLRFVGKDLKLNLFASNENMAGWLGRDQTELISALRDKGFHPHLHFAVLPTDAPPVPQAEIFADRPEPPPDDGQLDLHA